MSARGPGTVRDSGTVRLAFPLARLSEVPLALTFGVVAAAFGWGLALVHGASPIAPSGAGLVIAIVAGRLHRRGGATRALVALIGAGFAIGAAGVALEMQATRAATALVTLAFTTASAFPLREGTETAALRGLLAALTLLLLCAGLGSSVADAPTLTNVLAASAPVALAAWALDRVELRVERPRVRLARGPYR